MRATHAKVYIALAGICIGIAGCSGGGASSASTQPTTTPSTPTPTPTPINGVSPGPTIVIWKGDGAFTSQSDPNWPLSFTPEPGNPIGFFTNGPPIVYSAVGQSVTVSVSQANYGGPLPTLAIFTGSCTGLTGLPVGTNLYRVFYNSVGHSNCTVQFNGQNNGSYQGFAALVPIVVPNGG